MEVKTTGERDSFQLVPDAILCVTLAYLDLVSHVQLRITSHRLGLLSERAESAPNSIAIIVPTLESTPSVMRSLSTMHTPRLELKECPIMRMRRSCGNTTWAHGLRTQGLVSLSRMTCLRELRVRLCADVASAYWQQGNLLSYLTRLRVLAITLDQCSMDLAALAPLTLLETLHVAWDECKSIGEAKIGVALQNMPSLRSLRLEHQGLDIPDNVFSWAYDSPKLPASLTSLHLGESRAIVSDYSAGWPMVTRPRLETLELCGLMMSAHSFADLLQQQPTLVCVQVFMIAYWPIEKDDGDVLRSEDETKKDVTAYLKMPSPHMRHFRLRASPEHLRWCVQLMPRLHTIYCDCISTYALSGLGNADLPQLRTLHLDVSLVNEAIKVLCKGWNAPALERLTLMAPNYPTRETLTRTPQLAVYANLRALRMMGATLGSEVALPHLPHLETFLCEGLSTVATYTGPLLPAFNLAFPVLKHLHVRVNGTDYRSACVTTVKSDPSRTNSSGKRQLAHALHDRTSLQPWVSYHPRDDDVWITPQSES
jgi:hypothetical protein